MKTKSVADYINMLWRLLKKRGISEMLLACILLSLLFGGITRSTIRWIDDTYHACIAENVQRDGIFHVKKPFSDKYYFEKSVFVPLLISLGQKIAPDTGFGCKLFLLIEALFFFLFIYLILRLRRDKMYAFVVVVVMVTTQFFLFYTRRVGFDASVTFYVTLSLVYFYFHEGKRWLVVLSGCFAGLAFMAKGMQGLWAPLLILVSMIYEPSLRKRPLSHIAILTASFLIVVLPWHVYMLYYHGSAFYETYLWGRQGSYFFAVPGGPGNNWPFWSNFLKLIQNYWPWLPFFLLGGWTYFRYDRGKKPKSVRGSFIGFSVIAFALVFTVYQIAVFKRPYLTLIAYPFAAFVVAYYIRRSQARRILTLSTAGLGLLLSVLFLVTPLGKILDNHKDLGNEYKALLRRAREVAADNMILYDYKNGKRNRSLWYKCFFKAHTPFPEAVYLKRDELTGVLTKTRTKKSMEPYTSSLSSRGYLRR